MALTVTSRTVTRARELRNAMMLPEVLLWKQLKARPDGYKFRRQHPAGIYILDFVCMSAKVAIEIDGVAHDRPTRYYQDVRRDAWLESHGYATIRIAARDVLRDMDAVIAYLVNQCRARNPLHHPSDGPPPLPGRNLRNFHDLSLLPRPNASIRNLATGHPAATAIVR